MTLNPYKSIVIGTLLLLIFAVSCSVGEGITTETQSVLSTVTYDDIEISESNLPLFADLNGFSKTKSSGADSSANTITVSLESLIDRDKTISKTFKQYQLTEIPFRSNETPSFAVINGSGTDVVAIENSTEISLFLVETYDIVQNIVDRMVVTMIPDKHYRDSKAGSPYSFINKDVFSGIIMFSDLNGSFRDVYVYGGDFYPIINAEVIDPADASSYRHYCYLSVLEKPLTKGGDDTPEDGGELDPSICIGDNDSKLEGDFDWWNDYSEDAEEGGGGGSTGGTRPDTGDNSSGGGSSGGGSSSGSTLDPSDGSFDDRIDGDKDDDVTDDERGGLIKDDGSLPIIHDKQYYTVKLYSSEGGHTWGSGHFQPGTTVFCSAIANDGHVFDRWVGDLHGTDDVIAHVLNSDISATAYFRLLLESGPARPCLDTLTGIMNPLIEMSLAPSNTWSSNYKGATFGKTRTNGKFHSGLDLYAEPGTPIYSMFDGVINGTIYITEQPMRDAAGYYPDHYTGDDDDSGNRIYIDSEINGEAISIGYWHLLVDKPVAINPRTGEPFKPGDIVYQGEVIAYSGRTGNAYNVDYAHLHLVVKKINKFIDPEPYINGKLNSTGTNQNKVVSSTDINNIKCH